jgi:hypothetical protein
MNEKWESTFSLLAALFVLFTALLAPPVAAGLAVIFLATWAIYKFIQSRKITPGSRGH